MRRIATDQWEELPAAIIINEEVKEINAKKAAGRQKMNKKAMSRGETKPISVEP